MTRDLSYNLNESEVRRINPRERMPRQHAMQYLADMLLELRNLSKVHECSTLQGLLEIAYYEAFGEAHRVGVPQGEEEFLRLLGADALKAASQDFNPSTRKKARQ